MASTKKKTRPTGPRPRDLVKKTITMSRARERIIDEAVAEGRAPSASSYIEQALAAFVELESYDELLAEWRREVGPATREEKAWAAAAVARSMSRTKRAAG